MKLSLLTAAMAALGVTTANVVAQDTSYQDIVTWDEQSLFIRGERIMIFGGEFHPFRTPVPTVWRDVFEKIKALGMNTVVFYVDWALLEGKAGVFSAEDVFALQPFIKAAEETGMYLIPRPGPYINAEASGGGFPGWLQRISGRLRTSDQAFLNATQNYINHVGGIMADAQITNGGPVILYQIENEYFVRNAEAGRPAGGYMQSVIDQARAVGIKVPLINNDENAYGHNAPSSGVGGVDIYGHDSYYLGFNCANTKGWDKGAMNKDFRAKHLKQSPTTPFTIVETQGGIFLHWGGDTFDQCAELYGAEFERVFYKNLVAAGVRIWSIYMTAGGTNWGNLGFHLGFTSYDYGAAIGEDRNVLREKYSELKLLAQFLKVSPAYLVADPQELSTTAYTNNAEIAVTPIVAKNGTAFYVVRHDDELSMATTQYKLTITTRDNNKLSIPQLGGSLSLNGRDSKIHLVNYAAGDNNIQYSTAEVLTWKKFNDTTILIVYGGVGEQHEMQIATTSQSVSVTEGDKTDITIKQDNSTVILGWKVQGSRRTVQVGSLAVMMLSREAAYEYWIPELTIQGQPHPYGSSAQTANSIIVKGSRLVRRAVISDDLLQLYADFNTTTVSEMEVFGVPQDITTISINDKPVSVDSKTGLSWKFKISPASPALSIPDLGSLTWKYADSLPEISANYDDSQWPNANLSKTYNIRFPNKTPVSLFSGDYGFHAGSLMFRGKFTANGREKTLRLNTQGGSAFGTSVWFDGKYLGSWTGTAEARSHEDTFTLPALKAGQKYTFTVLIDQMGYEEDGLVGQDIMKTPRGILDFQLDQHNQSDVAWKITGNLGGENYHDRARGPLNEGALFAERQGWHLPSPPSESWPATNVTKKLSPGAIGLFTTEFDLAMPKGYDIPLYLSIANSTRPAPAYRAQIFINGFQFGEYINHIGPQTDFILPEGILDYSGRNWLAITLWSQSDSPVGLDGVRLRTGAQLATGYGPVTTVEAPIYQKRNGAY